MPLSSEWYLLRSTDTHSGGGARGFSSTAIIIIIVGSCYVLRYAYVKIDLQLTHRL